ncbi:MAG TPA: ABC transporter substrate-binding protein, partial [Flavobacteriales bacterium]|nr:ABC transporter substrate-binding protein [Flavobacteriales bacterium]
PAYAARFEDSWAIGHIFNGLVQFDKNLEVIPCIARRWEISEDGTEYTFYLRNDVFFHDDDAFENGKGRKVVASDFVNSFFRICDFETASPGLYIFQNVNTDKKGTTKGFLAENDSVFKIFLKIPQSDFLMKLTLPYCSVLPVEAIDTYGDDFRKHPVGTGPFKFKLWQEEVKLVLIKNENYFEKDEEGVKLPYVDAVTVSFMDDKNIEVGEFMKGRLDFISGFHPSIQTNLLSNQGKLQPEVADKYKLIRAPWLKTDYIGIFVDTDKELTQKSALRSREIRLAINYGIDRKGMVKYFRSGIGIPAEHGFIPEGMPGFSGMKIEGYTYNPEKAKELLFESGLNLTDEEKHITIFATKEYKELCEYLRKELEALGFTSSIELVPASVFKQRIAM